MTHGTRGANWLAPRSSWAAQVLGNKLRQIHFRWLKCYTLFVSVLRQAVTFGCPGQAREIMRFKSVLHEDPKIKR